MAVMHKIKAWLYKNLLTSDPDDFVIRPIAEKTLSVKEICKAAEERGNSDISAEAMEHAVDLFHNETEYQLCDGYSVNTGLYTAGPYVRGGAKHLSEKYDRKKHTLLFLFHQGARLRKALENVEVEIIGVADTDAVIEYVTDVKSGSVNDLLTPNRNLKIAGYKVKLAGDNEANGVYFVNQATAERTKVDNTDIVVNNPSEVIVVIPELTTGEYQLEIVTQYAVSFMLKEPRTALFNKVLTVE